MLSTSIPARIPLPFANSASSTYKNTIPVASQIGITNGKASLTDGFPPLTFQAISSGGVPPFGADFNGILNEITAIQQWQNAGGFFPYDSAFSTSIGGYPKGAYLQSTTFDGFWISIIESNTNNPDVSGTGWKPYFFSGLQAIAVTSTAQSLSNVQAAYSIIKFSGVLTGNTTITIPNYIATWTIGNYTTGAYTLTIRTAAGTGVTLVQGESTSVYGDGTNIYFSDSAKVASFNGRVGIVTLNSGDVTGALGYTPANALNIGSFYSVSQYNTSTTITLADKGKLIVVGGSGGTFTLPTSASFAAGGAITFASQGAAFTLTRVGSDVLSIGSGTGVTSYTVTGTGYITLVSNGAGIWYASCTSNLVVQTFNGRTGTVTLSSSDVTGALGYTPSNIIYTGSYSGSNQYNVNTTLTVANVGQLTVAGSSGQTFTLPNASTVPVGGKITIQPEGGAYTVVPPSGNTLFLNSSNVGSVGFGGADYIEITATSTTSWIVSGGNSTLPWSPQFANSGATNGYYRLPSGIIVQWGYRPNDGTTGSSVTNYPISFPTACWNVSVTGDSTSVTGTDIFGVNEVGATGFRVWGSTNADTAATMKYFWQAIGY